MTVWDSTDSIRKFAGDRPGLAKYYPEDDEYLLEKEEFVQHHEIFHTYPED